MTRKQAVAILNDFIEDCPNEDWEQALQIAKNSCEKLEKIKQIIDRSNGFYLYHDLPPFQQIKEILEKE